MAVETRRNSKFWYGRYRSKTKMRECARLGVLVRGKPGSEEYEASKREAEVELAAFVEKLRQQTRPEENIQRLHEVKFGRRIGSLPLSRLAEAWVALPRRRPLGKTRESYGLSVLNRFVAFLREHHPKATELAAITPEMAEAFMKAEEDRNLRGSSYNAELSLLRSTLSRLRVKAGMLENPFEGNLVAKDVRSTPREPFTPEDLDRLIRIARAKDPEIADLIVVGACTALRLGDCATLRWTDIDLDAGRIRLRTRKTGEPVVLPLFPNLRDTLRGRPRDGTYVFPDLAASYGKKRWAVHDRLRAVFVAAALQEPGGHVRKVAARFPIDVQVPDDESLRTSVLQKIRAMGPGEVSERVKSTMVEVFDLYSSGLTIVDIVGKLGISKGSASNYIARIERAVGHPILRKEVEAVRLAQARRPVNGDEKDEAKKDGMPPEQSGRRRINSRGFHALRATFTTMALSAGVPVEMVRLITGHSLTETVLKHYFNPKADAILRTVEAAMPRLLTGRRDESVLEETIACIKGMTTKNLSGEKPRLLELIEKLRSEIRT